MDEGIEPVGLMDGWMDGYMCVHDAIMMPDDHPLTMVPVLAGLLHHDYRVLLYNGENDLSWYVCMLCYVWMDGWIGVGMYMMPDDHPLTMVPVLARLLHHDYRVLLYNGQNDLSWYVSIYPSIHLRSPALDQCGLIHPSMHLTIQSIQSTTYTVIS